MPSLQELGLEKLWIEFGQGASAQWIPVHEMVSSIGPEKVGGILFFHAFAGCDVVSGFRGKETFKKLSNCPQETGELRCPNVRPI